MTRNVLSFSTLAVVLAAVVTAQDAAPVAAQSLIVPRTPIHTAPPDSGIPYGVWAAADSYKVSFHDDATFIPYLGDAYPENLPLSWRTRAVTMGEAHAPSPLGVDARHHTAFRYERRFAQFTEAYDVLDAGLEQTFVIHTRPSGNGDLIVYGSISTALHADSFTAEHRAITFTDAQGRPVIRYGEAFAIDADGRRVDVTTSYRDGDVQLRVPAAWVAHAKFPVVVDPLLTRATLSVGASPSSIDVARDDTGNDLMLVFTRGVSASDQDLGAIMMNDVWGGGATVFTDVNTWNTPTASVATAASPQKYCIAFERQLPHRRVRAHLHDSGDFTIGTSVTSLEPAAAGNHDWRPDVGGQLLSSSTFTPTGSKFMLVFQRDFTGSTTFSNTATSLIYGRTLDADGTLGAEFPIAISVLSPIDHEWPSINQQGKRTGSAASRSDWLVAFQRYSGPEATWRVRGKLVRDDGTNSLETWTPSSDSATSHRLTPKVGGHTGRYLVSCVETTFAAAPFKTTAIVGLSLRTERVGWVAGGTPANYPERVVDGPVRTANLQLGGVAYDGDTSSHWAVTYHSDRDGAGNGQAHVLRTGYQGLVTEQQVLYNPAAATEQGLAGGVCFDADADDFVAAFGRSTGTSGQIYGNRLTYNTPTPAVVSGVSCSSGQIAWAGVQQIGSEFGSVRLTGAPANAGAFVILSLASADLNLSFLGMNGCRLLADLGAGHIATLPAVANASGSASLSLPLPGSLTAFAAFFQWFHVDVGANPLNLVSTQRVRVDFAK